MMKKVIRIALGRQQFSISVYVTRYRADKPGRLYGVSCDDCGAHIADLRPCYFVPIILRRKWKAGAGVSKLSGQELCRQCLHDEAEIGF